MLLAGGTRKRGSPSATAITAPFPGAAAKPVSSLHSDPRVPSGHYAHALRVPFQRAMRCAHAVLARMILAIPVLANRTSAAARSCADFPEGHATVYPLRIKQ